jgi:hypothetical protein
VFSARPAVAQAQDLRARFEIVSSSDTSFSLVLGEERWVRAGMGGIVVDPRMKDEFVARFVIVALEERTALARITGMTTGISEFHMALIAPPRRPWYKQAFFWIPLVIGGAVGYLIGRG